MVLGSITEVIVRSVQVGSDSDDGVKRNRVRFGWMRGDKAESQILSSPLFIYNAQLLTPCV